MSRLFGRRHQAKHLGGRATWRRKNGITMSTQEPDTEAERTRRANRDFLRNRDEDDVPEFEVEDDWDQV